MGEQEPALKPEELDRLESLARKAGKIVCSDWQVFRDDSGSQFSGWPSVVSDTDDVAIVHRAGFKQEFWGDWSPSEAVDLATYIAAIPPSTLLRLIAQARAIPPAAALVGKLLEAWRLGAVYGLGYDMPLNIYGKQKRDQDLAALADAPVTGDQIKEPT